MFIDRIHRIDPTKTYNFNPPILFTFASHKIIAKFGILCPTTLLLTEKQLHGLHFFDHHLRSPNGTFSIIVFTCINRSHGVSYLFIQFQMVVARWNTSEGSDREGPETRVASAIFGSWDKMAHLAINLRRRTCNLWQNLRIKNSVRQGKCYCNYFRLFC